MLTLIMLFLCTVLLSCAFLAPKIKSADAQVSGYSVDVEEIYGGSGFSGTNVKKLFSLLTGVSDASYESVENFLSSAQGGAVPTSGFSKQDIIVTFCDLDWTPTYLTYDRDGDIILTLWEAYSTVTSKWAAFSSTTAGAYPSSLYGTSYMRAVVLNNGGDYATSNSALTTATQDANNKYAKFTMSSVAGNVTKFLVPPSQVPYQEELLTHNLAGTTYNYANECYTDKVLTNGNMLNSYQLNSNYRNWVDDLIWLPGLAETGKSTANGQGLWKTSLNQRKCGDKSVWLRAVYNASNTAACLVTSGDYSTGVDVLTENLIRPAIHLNLTKLGYSVKDVEVTYSGSAKTLADVEAEQKSWYNSEVMVITYLTSSMVNVGSYTVKVELNAAAIADGLIFTENPDPTKGNGDESATLRYITFKIKPKALDATLTETDGEVTLTVDPSGLCGTDSMPATAIQYTSTDGGGYSSTDAPQQKGSFKAEPKITDSNSNYELACTPASITYTIDAIKVELPTLPPTAVPTYDGTLQTIALSGYTHNGKGVNLYSVSGKTAGNKTITSATYDAAKGEVSVKEAGTYTVTLTLEDVTNCVWKADGSNGRKELTFEVKPKQLGITVSNDNENIWSWGVGTAVEATVSVTGIMTGDTLKLTTKYGAASGAEVKSNGTSSVGESVSDRLSLPDNLIQGTYTLTAEIDNENYSIEDGMAGAGMPITFTIGAQVFNPDTFGWLYSENNATGTQEIKDGDSFLKYKLDSAGSAYKYTLTINLGTNAGVFQTVTDTDYTDNVQTNAGTYTTKVKLTIRNENYSFDTTKTYEHANILSTTQAEVYITWTIEKGDFEGLENLPWVYRYGTSGSWTDYNPARPPEYGNGTVTVKMKGDVEGTLKGLTFNYGGVNSSRDKGEYTVKMSFGVTDSSNFNIPQGFIFTWEITKKIINVQWEQDVLLTYDGTKYPEWTGNEYFATQLRYENAEYAEKVDYIYSCTLPDGTPYTGRGVEALAYITEQAQGAQKRVEVEVRVELKSDTTILSDYELVDTTGGDFTTSFMVGDNKLAAKVELTASGEYGEFEYNVAVTGEDMDSSKYTVTVYRGTNINDVTSTENERIENFDPATADAGNYIVVVTLTGDWGDEYRLSGGKKAFTIYPKSIPVPTLAEITFTGAEQSIIEYLGGSWEAYKDIITVGGEYEGIRNVREGGYVATLTLANSNYRWDYGTAEATVKLQLSARVVSEVITEGSDTVASYKWNISPLVVDTTNMWNKGKSGATLNLPANIKALIDGETLSVGYRYYDGATGEFVESPEIKGGKTFKVDAVFGGFDAESGNVVFKTGENTVGSVAPQINYTVPQSGAAAFFGNALSFVKSNWLWFVIALAILLFLIILIVIIAKRRKNKEEREAKKEAKEEEKRRKEEERQRKEEEREEAKRKYEQELELAKMKAQMGLGAGAAGLAMAMQQPAQAQQQMLPQQQPYQAPAQPQPAQQQQPYPQMQAQPQYAADPSVLAEIKADIRELKAQQRNNSYAQPVMQMPAVMPQQPVMPAYGPQQAMPQYTSGGAGSDVLITMLQNQLNEMRTVNSDKEIASLKTQLEIMKLRTEQQQPQAAVQVQNIPQVKAENADIEKFGAFAAALWRNMNTMPAPKAVPQRVEESKPVSVAYPTDAVVTTTTTVDTTKNAKPSPRSDDGRLFDVDGFYDAFEEK